eukprot:gb/GECG01006183.1/.p1 GENE.gb/GECG01006183.1/~~gb/GECG01006183.1/.p1  ORF type:complete len:301 (+),score=22.10 gb/GECG01006183.1/:1-903(+)
MEPDYPTKLLHAHPANCQVTELQYNKLKHLTSDEELPKMRKGSTASNEMKGDDPVGDDDENTQETSHATSPPAECSNGDDPPPRRSAGRRSGGDNGRTKRKRIEQNHRQKVGELFNTLSKVLGNSDEYALRLTRPLILEMAIERLSGEADKPALPSNGENVLRRKRGRDNSQLGAEVCPSCGSVVNAQPQSAPKTIGQCTPNAANASCQSARGYDSPLIVDNTVYCPRTSTPSVASHTQLYSWPGSPRPGVTHVDPPNSSVPPTNPGIPTAYPSVPASYNYPWYFYAPSIPPTNVKCQRK